MTRINVPESLCGVYHIIRDGQVVYVGQTVNVFSRISTWRSGKFSDEHFDAVEFFPCEIEELNDLEESHIRQLQPPLNAQGVTSPYRPPIRAHDAPRWWHERRAIAGFKKRQAQEAVA